jgi:hypothetical protein
MWCSTVRLDAREKGKRSGIAVGAVVIAVVLVFLKEKP